MTPLQNYLRIKAIRRDSTAIIENGKEYRIVNGELMTKRDFDRVYKLPLKIVEKANPNGKAI